MSASIKLFLQLMKYEDEPFTMSYKTPLCFVDIDDAKHTA